jgi:hemoglobin-like flavoprotein
MLTRALAAVIDRVEDGAWLTETLHALGAKHVDYGVTEEMYPWVGDALLSALEEAAGDAWTPRVKTAWSDAFAAIAGLMIAGARAVASPRSEAAFSGTSQ